MQLEDCLEQLKAEYMNIAEFLISQGGVMEVTSEHGDSSFCLTAIRLTRFQEKVEEDALHEDWAARRGAWEHKLKRNMAEKSQLLQTKSRDAYSSNLFISTKTRIKQLEVDIAEAMMKGARSH